MTLVERPVDASTPLHTAPHTAPHTSPHTTLHNTLNDPNPTPAEGACSKAPPNGSEWPG